VMAPARGAGAHFAPFRLPGRGQPCDQEAAMDVSAYDLLSTAVLLLDVEGRVGYANTAAEELFGSSRRMLVGMPANELLGNEGTLQAHLMEAVAGRFGILKQPLSISRQGSHTPVSVAVIPLRDVEPWAALIELRVLDQHM